MQVFIKQKNVPQPQLVLQDASSWTNFQCMFLAVNRHLSNYSKAYECNKRENIVYFKMQEHSYQEVNMLLGEEQDVEKSIP